MVIYLLGLFLIAASTWVGGYFFSNSIWGYVIGSLVGSIAAELLKRFFKGQRKDL
jgi:hypothetical protein